MLKAYKYRLYPTDSQKVLINKHIGACRFIYNLALETKQMAWASYRVNISSFELMKQIPDLKSECDWLKEINAQSIQQSISNLDVAYTLFFKSRNEFPRYKKKSNSGSFTVKQRISLNADRFIMPKFREGVKIALHRPIKGDIKQANVSKTTSGKYFVSILCETGESNIAKVGVKEKSTVGIDLGIKTYLVTSSGQEFDNPKYLKKSLGKLKYIQSKYSKNKGRRTRQKLALLHEKVANQRKDFLHKTSTKLIRENQSIAIEDLNVQGLLKNHKLAQSIADASWGEFVRQLEYKGEWYGVNILKIGRFEPSSKMCSNCGATNQELTLNDRKWTCKNCNTTHERDINAAINIKSFALKNILSGTDRKNQNELPTLVGVMTSEAHKE